jgi:hypothetical protein
MTFDLCPALIRTLYVLTWRINLELSINVSFKMSIVFARDVVMDSQGQVSN